MSDFNHLWTRVFFRKRLWLAKYPNIRQEIVEQARNEQSRQITPYHIPTKDFLEDKQEEHLDKETGDGSQVEYNEPLPEIGPTLTIDAAFPYPKVRPKEVAQHGKFERNDRRKDIYTEVGLENEVRTYPKHQCIDTGTEDACQHKL